MLFFQKTQDRSIRIKDVNLGRFILHGFSDYTENRKKCRKGINLCLLKFAVISIIDI